MSNGRCCGLVGDPKLGVGVGGTSDDVGQYWPGLDASAGSCASNAENGE